MSTEVDNIFVDVRNAFRLLSEYQKKVLDIVNYIKDQSIYAGMFGRRWYFNPITNNRSDYADYANLKVYSGMWGWDFLYGYIFEYYLGSAKNDDKKEGIDMSIFQISDDGFFISDDENKHMTNTSSFKPVNDSHSYLIFNFTKNGVSGNTNMWLSNAPYPKNTEYNELEPRWKDFLTAFLSSSNPEKVVKGSNGEYIILKKYEMQRFHSQQSADDVIRDFANLVKEETGISLFKEEYYDHNL